MIGTNLAGAIAGAAGDFLADPGMVLVAAIAVGVPLAFVLITIIINAFSNIQSDPLMDPATEYHDRDLEEEYF